ncbi:MAG: response regulator, partial [Verrucomicrobiaceae bacterium]
HRESPDFILMDLQMPEMDGIEATREIRRIEKASRTAQPAIIVALTANTVPADRGRCFEAGMNDYLNKPVSIRALAGVLMQAGGSLQSVR